MAEQSQAQAAAVASADAPAQPFNALAAELGLPLSTLHLLRARGEGPECFKLGRRLYVSREAKAAWIAELQRKARMTAEQVAA